MSKIGKNPIQIPDKIDVSVAGGVVSVKGPLGAVSRTFNERVSVVVDGKVVTVTPKDGSKFARSMWGTAAAHIKNMIKGVSGKYEKKLELQGVGYKVEATGKTMKFALGFSHPVTVAVPEGVAVLVEKGIITISGVDKDEVGQFAARVRALKKPEPYKGKGIRYVGEYVRSKEGKKAVG